MTKGTCMCGEYTFEYEDDLAAVAICHCIPCRKSAGLNGSYNFIVPDDKFKKLSGKDKLFHRTGDSGKDVKYTSCDNCPCIIFVQAEALPGVKILKGGLVDDNDARESGKPNTEIYTRNRPTWCPPWPCEQKEAA